MLRLVAFANRDNIYVQVCQLSISGTKVLLYFLGRKKDASGYQNQSLNVDAIEQGLMVTLPRKSCLDCSFCYFDASTILSAQDVLIWVPGWKINNCFSLLLLVLVE